MSNRRLWDALGKTDPSQTKSFQRAGGFKGTAIKPMWSNLRMTEQFGPCGLGWGPDKPEFETREAGEEMLVFCTVGLWYREGEVLGRVYGVGGDKYLIKQKDGLRSSDEAYKAAYTDALGNAMKLIGVAADVHMGMFDDSKYVQEMRGEFSGDPQRTQRATKPVNMDSEPNEYDEHMQKTDKPKIISKAKADALRASLVSRSVPPANVRKQLQEFGFMTCSEITEDRYQDVKDALDGL